MSRTALEARHTRLEAFVACTEEAAALARSGDTGEALAAVLDRRGALIEALAGSAPIEEPPRDDPSHGLWVACVELLRREARVAATLTDALGEARDRVRSDLRVLGRAPSHAKDAYGKAGRGRRIDTRS